MKALFSRIWGHLDLALFRSTEEKSKSPRVGQTSLKQISKGGTMCGISCYLFNPCRAFDCPSGGQGPHRLYHQQGTLLTTKLGSIKQHAQPIHPQKTNGYLPLTRPQNQPHKNHTRKNPWAMLRRNLPSVTGYSQASMTRQKYRQDLRAQSG